MINIFSALLFIAAWCPLNLAVATGDHLDIKENSPAVDLDCGAALTPLLRGRFSQWHRGGGNGILTAYLVVEVTPQIADVQNSARVLGVELELLAELSPQLQSFRATSIVSKLYAFLHLHPEVLSASLMPYGNPIALKHIRRRYVLNFDSQSNRREALPQIAAFGLQAVDAILPELENDPLVSHLLSENYLIVEGSLRAFSLARHLSGVITSAPLSVLESVANGGEGLRGRASGFVTIIPATPPLPERVTLVREEGPVISPRLMHELAQRPRRTDGGQDATIAVRITVMGRRGGMLDAARVESISEAIMKLNPGFKHRVLLRGRAFQISTLSATPVELRDIARIHGVTSIRLREEEIPMNIAPAENLSLWQQFLRNTAHERTGE